MKKAFPWVMESSGDEGKVPTTYEVAGLYFFRCQKV